jgi:hypothetical protein
MKLNYVGYIHSIFLFADFHCLAGFDLSIEHPHTNVVKTCQLVKGECVLANLT